MFLGVCAKLILLRCFEKWIRVYHVIYDYSLSSWPTSQLVNNFMSGTAIFIKSIDSNPLLVSISNKKLLAIFTQYIEYNRIMKITVLLFMGLNMELKSFMMLGFQIQKKNYTIKTMGDCALLTTHLLPPFKWYMLLGKNLVELSDTTSSL